MLEGRKRYARNVVVDLGFPIRLSSNPLSAKNYYNFILDGFQALCRECKVLPYVMDAAIFSSYDDEWSEDRLIW